MTATYPAGRKALATYFLRAARRYWLSVFPCIRRETRHWRERAEAIPDPVLRRLALEAQRIKRGNIEGSAAFAAFAPAAHRDEVVRAQVAFQSAYDYADTLSEQASGNPVKNGRQLHQALLAALDDRPGQPDYYARNPRRGDAGYLEGIVDACRCALSELPSRPSITLPAHRLATRIVAYQSLNLSEPHGGRRRAAQPARLLRHAAGSCRSPAAARARSAAHSSPVAKRPRARADPRRHGELLPDGSRGVIAQRTTHLPQGHRDARAGDPAEHGGARRATHGQPAAAAARRQDFLARSGESARQVLAAVGRWV